MLKALLKKQLKELFYAFRGGNRNKKARSRLGTVGIAILLLYVVVVFAGAFYIMMRTLCQPLFAANLAWLYFALAGIMATAFSIVGSVFMTKSQLYDARDNELLLSLPIATWKILFCRMLTLYLQNFIFCAMVFVPAIAASVPLQVSAGSVVCCVLLLLLLPLFSLALTCILGWLVAAISARMRNKSLVAIVLYLAFFGLYFYGYSNLNTYLQMILANSTQISAKIQVFGYPFYQMGLAAGGRGMAMAIFAVIALALFALVYAFLSHGFLKIATTKRGEKKVQYREKSVKARSVGQALLGKEVRRYLKSPIYLLNTSVGTVFLVIVLVMAIVQRESLETIMTQFPEMVSPVVCAGLCLLAAMNMVTAPSISLEAKNLSLLQSLPVSGWQILKGKLTLHMVVSVPMTVLCAAIANIFVRPTLLMAALTLAMPVGFILFSGVLGLCFDLLKPNLSWSSEAVAVKQSPSVVFTMLVIFGVAAAFVLAYIFLGDAISLELFLSLCTVVLAVADVLLLHWLKRRGARILEFL